MNLKMLLLQLYYIIMAFLSILLNIIALIYTKYDLNILMYLKPETIKYNQTIINRYSKTCRVSFGNSECKINKSLL